MKQQQQHNPCAFHDQKKNDKKYYDYLNQTGSCDNVVHKHLWRGQGDLILGVKVSDRLIYETGYRET